MFWIRYSWDFRFIRKSNFLYLTIIFAVITLVVSSNSKPRVSPSFFSELRQETEDDESGRVITYKRQVFPLEQVMAENVPVHFNIGPESNSELYTRHFLSEEQMARLTSPQLIKAVGYEVEIHKVATDDDYILTVYRVKNPVQGCLDPYKPPIFFQHGIVDSSRAWLVLDGDTGPAYTAAKFGFDVWIGNARGTNDSLEHKFYSSKDPKFWNFSFHEMGKYDLPTVFRYILDHTKETNIRQKINYVGHSMGTTMFYVCLSLFPEWNRVIESFVALPPSAFLSSITSPLKYLKPYSSIYNDFLIDGPFLPREINSLIHKLGPLTCDIRLNPQGMELCIMLTALLEGSSILEQNSTILHRVLSHFPTTTSKKTVAHFLQMVDADFFAEYDYGILKNFQVYNNTVPPKYNLINVAVNTLNIYGQQDILIDYKDSETSNVQIGPFLKTNFLVFDYSHVDFIWGNTAGPVVAYRYLSFLNELSASKTKIFLAHNQNRGPLDNLSGDEEEDCQCECAGGICHKKQEDNGQ